MTDRTQHWDGVYAATASTALSWFDPEAATSIRLIEHGGRKADGVVDVGAGTSRLVDHLLARGYIDLTVLDVSGSALDEVRARLGTRSDDVSFVYGDVLDWQPGRVYDVWHDRAVFHFLTDGADRARYVAVAAAAVRAGGRVVLGTFAEDGPTQCSGLAVCRYSPEALAAEFGAFFSLVDSERKTHCTPGGVVQPFTWVVLRRT